MKTDFYVLATYVQQRQLLAIRLHLNALVGNGNWNFDLEDCDRVLRLHCKDAIKQKVIRFLNRNELFKKELHYQENEQYAHIGKVRSLSMYDISINP